MKRSFIVALLMSVTLAVAQTVPTDKEATAWKAEQRKKLVEQIKELQQQLTDLNKEDLATVKKQMDKEQEQATTAKAAPAEITLGMSEADLIDYCKTNKGGTHLTSTSKIGDSVTKEYSVWWQILNVAKKEYAPFRRDVTVVDGKVTSVSE